MLIALTTVGRFLPPTVGRVFSRQRAACSVEQNGRRQTKQKTRYFLELGEDEVEDAEQRGGETDSHGAGPGRPVPCLAWTEDAPA